MSSPPHVYATDLSDVEWAILAPLLPPPKPGGRPRKWTLRTIMDGIFYLVRSGCQWRLLPREFPPWQTVYLERTISWFGQSRRLSKDYERLSESGEAMIYATMTRIMLRRLAKA